MVACIRTFVPIGPSIFHSDKYNLEVKLPAVWGAVEGPESLVPTAHLEGLVAFNSWGQSDFWARAIDNGTGSGITYSGSVIASQIPFGGAYVALVLENGPPYEGTPPEYKFNDLRELYEPHDWRQDSASYAYFKTFYRDGLSLRLEIFCHPDASDENVNALNNLLKSWRFLK